MATFFFALLSFMCQFLVTSAFASMLTGEHCNKPMDVGIMMMGMATELSEVHSLQIFRQDMTEVSNGGTYDPSEEMTIKLFPKLFQAAFEVRGATFISGKCGGNRVAGQSATIKFPSLSEGMQNVSVHSAWAKSYSSGVKLVLPFILIPAEASDYRKGSDEF